MKALLIHNEYQQPGGEDIVFHQEQQLLSRFGHIVLTYRRSNHEIGRASRLQQILLPKQLIWSERARREVARILEDESPDIVHVHNTFTQISPSIYSACREAKVPVVQTLHNFRLLCPAATFYRNGRVCEECVTHSLWQSVKHRCYRGSLAGTVAVAGMLAAHRTRGTWERDVDIYIALTNFARQKFVREGFAAEKIRVKPNFVASDPGHGKEKASFALFVGRLSEEKGLRTLLSAWTHIKPSIRLFLVGDGPLRSELEKYVEDRGLTDVSFLGRVPHEKTQEAIKAARFLILPSACYENFPMTIAEAFATGTPVICSHLGAMQEIVEAGRTGLHFAPNDSKDLADKVSWAWTHPERMRHMGDEARKEYETKYTAEINYGLLMNIYASAMKKAAPLEPASRGSADVVQANTVIS